MEILKRGKIPKPPKPEKKKKAKCPNCRSVIGYYLSDCEYDSRDNLTYYDKKGREVVPHRLICPVCKFYFIANEGDLVDSYYYD